MLFRVLVAGPDEEISATPQTGVAQRPGPTPIKWSAEGRGHLTPARLHRKTGAVCLLGPPFSAIGERTFSTQSAKSCRSRNVRVGCVPCKGGAFQWVQIPSGNRSNRKQSEQSWR